MSNKKIKVVSLFSGIGGFEEGLNNSKLNYELVFSSEIDENAQKSYLANFPDSNLKGDITKIDALDIPDHDMLVGGFPCQTFSIAGKRKGFEEARGTLFFDVCRILKEKKPYIVFLENVKNLVSHDDSRTIMVILSNLNNLGYTVDFDVLNAMDFGVAQSRERTYIIGVLNREREAYSLTSSNKKINALKTSLNSRGYNGFNFFSNLKCGQDRKYIKDILDKDTDLSKYYISNPAVEEYLKDVCINNEDNTSEIVKVLDLPRDVWNDLDRQRRVYSINGVSPTVLARSDSTKILVNDYGKTRIRKFTPSENFKAMGFSDKFVSNIVKTGMSNTCMYKQSGNAVCPPVITSIANLINDQFYSDDRKKFIDLFCGLGGFRIAFEKQKMKCVFSSDIDATVKKVYEMNFNDFPSGDITKIKASEIPNHDVLCAGFPCQPFSLAGKRLGFEDARGTLFFEVARIMKERRPKFAMLENVAGLVSHDSGKTLNTIISVLDDIGYWFDYRVMNACDFGVPQNRERWYGIAIRKDYKQIMDENEIFFNFPKKRPLEYTLEDILDKNVSNEYTITETCEKNIKIHLEKFIKMKRYNKDNPLIATEIRPSRCNFRCDGISPCLTAKMGTGGNNVPVVVYQKRKYTEKECLKIMSFPETYIIPANKMQTYKQLGNSVVVSVITLFAEEISRIMREVDHL